MSVLHYMLDTNIVSESVRRPDGEAARRAVSLEPRSVAVSIIVAVELRYGAARRRSARLTGQFETCPKSGNAFEFADTAGDQRQVEGPRTDVTGRRAERSLESSRAGAGGRSGSRCGPR